MIFLVLVKCLFQRKKVLFQQNIEKKLFSPFSENLLLSRRFSFASCFGKKIPLSGDKTDFKHCIDLKIIQCEIKNTSTWTKNFEINP